MPPSDLRHRLLAIMAADGVRYSRLMSIDERATMSALDSAREVFRSHLAYHHGRVMAASAAPARRALIEEKLIPASRKAGLMDEVRETDDR